MRVLALFSWESFKQSIAKCCSRFPVACVMCIALALFLLVMNYCSASFAPFRLRLTIIVFTISASFLSVALKLHEEAFKPARKAKILWYGAYFVLLAAVLYVAYSGLSETLTKYSFVAVVVIIGATFVSMSFAPFYKEKDDMPFWNLTIKLLSDFALACICAIVIYALIALLFFSFTFLFDVNVGDKAFINLLIAVACVIAPAIFLQLIPAKDNIHDTTATQGFAKIAPSLARYVLLPVTVAYLIALYVYAISIIAKWQLPDGEVTYLVATLVALMVLCVSLLYPSQHATCKKIDRLVNRWLPLLIVPILVLMSCGIIRRIMDYGITVARLYVVLLNVWSYAICFYLFAIRSKRIKGIVISFVVVLFIASVGPQSIPNVTKLLLIRNVKQALSSAGIKSFPASQNQYEAVMHKMQAQEAIHIDSQMGYLNRDFFDCNIKQSGIVERYVPYYNFDGVAEDLGNSVSELLEHGETNLPVGYNKFIFISPSLANVEMIDTTGNTLVFSFTEIKQYEFHVSKQTLLDVDNNSKKELVLKDGNAILYVNEFGYWHDELNYVGGVLFVK